MKTEREIKPCPICHDYMHVKSWDQADLSEKIYYSIYCRRCGYGLREAFASRLYAIEHWNKVIC